MNRLRGWQALAAAFVAAVALVGCGGSDGDAGPQGDRGPQGDQGDPGPAGPPGSGAVNLAAITPEQWEAAEFQASVSSIVIASPPVVTFTVTDKVGNPVVGLENVKSLAAGNTLATYPNLSFAIAKLEPRTDAKPSSWVSYIVTGVSNATGAITGAQRPGTDNNGTLEAVAGTPGTYKYTFRRDIPGTKAAVDALTFTGNNRKEDLGDLTYAPTLPHRLTIQISGAAPGLAWPSAWACSRRSRSLAWRIPSTWSGESL